MPRETCASLTSRGAVCLSPDAFRFSFSGKPESCGTPPRGANSMRAGQVADALNYFTQASALAPQVAEIKLNIAIALKDEGKYQEEISALQSALKLNPSL